MSGNAHKISGSARTWPSRNLLLYPNHQKDVNSAENGLVQVLPSHVSASK